MRTPFVAGNWKMNKTIAQARQLVTDMLPDLKAVKGVEIVLCPPFTALAAVSEALSGSKIGLGSQNLHWEASGAYTGEVSPQMVAEVCQYAIIGHSERRAYFGETDETVNRKIKAALANQLVPIVCVGETLAEYEAGITADVISRQILEGLKELTRDQGEKLVIAYEPVWAIGTGRAATSTGANAVIADVIRPVMAKVFDKQVATDARVLYGGSVTATNAAEFFATMEIDGALVGGASLKPQDFVRIVQAAAK